MIITLVTGLCAAGSVIFLGFSYSRWRMAQQIINDAKQSHTFMQKEVEAERRESLLKLKDELYNRRMEFENEVKRERGDVDKERRRVEQQSAEVNRLDKDIKKRYNELQEKERDINRTTDQLRVNENKLKKLYQDLLAKLERASNLTQDDARKQLFETLKSEVHHAHEKWLQKAEEDVKMRAKERATDIVISAMQRYTADLVTPHTSGVVQLPNDEMKGRIIGKEGRNIKSLEMSTGVELVIGETPEIITISCFNPIRREIARRTLEKLIADGRINPTRIEETVTQCEKELDEIIEEKGKEAILRLNLHGVHHDIVMALGRLHFRTSYAQNVLEHSIEVGIFARMVAEELGFEKPEIAARAGLYHDMGKALSAEHDGPHAQIGADLAKRCGEDPLVVNAIAAHHEEVPFISSYDPIIIIADTLSASRPGARRETLSTYLKRLEKLESVAKTFDGVKKVYALQAGRELRVIIQEDILTDDDAHELARNVVQEVEKELSFPGQIKINVIRETRAIEYAR